jgi:hypothetical protein
MISTSAKTAPLQNSAVVVVPGAVVKNTPHAKAEAAIVATQKSTPSQRGDVLAKCEDRPLNGDSLFIGGMIQWAGQGHRGGANVSMARLGLDVRSAAILSPNQLFTGNYILLLLGFPGRDFRFAMLNRQQIKREQYLTAPPLTDEQRATQAKRMREYRRSRAKG